MPCGLAWYQYGKHGLTRTAQQKKRTDQNEKGKQLTKLKLKIQFDSSIAWIKHMGYPTSWPTSTRLLHWPHRKNIDNKKKINKIEEENEIIF